MSLTPRRSAALLLVAAWAAGACTSPLAPSDIAGTYALRTLRGETLPTQLNDQVTNSPLLLADTLHLSRDGNGLWVDVYEFESVTPGGPPDTVRFTMAVEVLRQGGQLLLAERFTCSPGVICRAPEVYAIGRWEGELVLEDGPRYYAKVRHPPPSPMPFSVGIAARGRLGGVDRAVGADNLDRQAGHRRQQR